MIALATALASGTPNSTSTLSDVEPGVLGFLVVAGIGVALIFLLRNMNKQFRKLGPPPGEETDAESASGEAGDEASGAEKPAGPARPPLAITAGDRVQTGDPEQDEKAEGTARRE